MKRLIAAAAVVGVVCGAIVLSFSYADRTPSNAPPPGAFASLTVACYNVQEISPHGGAAPWDERGESVAELIRRHDPDIVALQDVRTVARSYDDYRNVQLEWLTESFPDYTITAVGRPATYPSTQPVMVLSTRFVPMEQGFFFFSPTPDVIYADPWVGRTPYFCSWVRVVDSTTDQVVRLYNVGYPDDTRTNQSRAADLLARRVHAPDDTEDHVLVVGSFSAPAVFGSLKRLSGTGLTRAGPRGTTYHMGKGLNLLPAYDHIFIGSGFTVWDAWADRSRPNKAWPSDHYPIFATLTYR